MLEVVVLVVVGMLVKCLGPYVDRHVVSKAVEVASYDMRVDCGQPIATDSIQMRDRHCARQERLRVGEYCNANVLGTTIVHSRRAC
jgi:hypothetical protein